MTKLELSIDGVIVKQGDKLYRTFINNNLPTYIEFSHVGYGGDIVSTDNVSYTPYDWRIDNPSNHEKLSIEERVKKLEDALRNLNRSQSITPSFFQMNMHE